MTRLLTIALHVGLIGVGLIGLGTDLGSQAQADELVPALRHGNSQELVRLGSQLGASGLADHMLGEDRPLALAAIRASLGADDSFALLGHLARAARRPDRSIALLAVEVAAEIAQRSDLELLESEEVSDAQLLDWYQAWRDIVDDDKRWVDIRIYAFETAARLHELMSPSKRPVMELDNLLADEQAELRAAVLTLAPKHLAIESKALSFLASDRSELVALSAAQVVCGPLGMANKKIPNLSDAVAERVIRLASDGTRDIAARLDLAPCLAVIDSPESRKLLGVLTQSSPPALRASLLALTRKSSAK